MGHFSNPVLIVFLSATVAIVATTTQNTTQTANRSLARSSGNFYVSDFTRTWLGAVEHCHRLGKRLVVVDSAAKQNEVVRQVMSSYLAYNPVNTHIWIGASELAQQGQYVWHDSGLELRWTYTNWHPGQPDNFKGLEHCAEIWYQPSRNLLWHWNDAPCENSRFFVCEPRP